MFYALTKQLITILHLYISYAINVAVIAGFSIFGFTDAEHVEILARFQNCDALDVKIIAISNGRPRCSLKSISELQWFCETIHGHVVPYIYKYIRCKKRCNSYRISVNLISRTPRTLKWFPDFNVVMHWVLKSLQFFQFIW